MGQKELRLKRKMQGLCPTCGRVADRADFYECSACAEKHRMHRQRKIREGICVRCGSPNNNGKTCCNDCLALQRQESKEYREQRKEEGICVECGIRKVALKKRRCEICLAKNADRGIKRRETEDPVSSQIRRQKNNDRMKQRRKAAEEKGLCVQCCKRKPVYGHRACAECLARFRRWNREYKARNNKHATYTECIEYGICTTCQTRKATHGKLCDSCYSQAIQNLEKAWGKPNSADHFWIEDNKAAFIVKR